VRTSSSHVCSNVYECHAFLLRKAILNFRANPFKCVLVRTFVCTFILVRTYCVRLPQVRARQAHRCHRRHPQRSVPNQPQFNAVGLGGVSACLSQRGQPTRLVFVCFVSIDGRRGAHPVPELEAHPLARGFAGRSSSGRDGHLRVSVVV